VPFPVLRTLYAFRSGNCIKSLFVAYPGRIAEKDQTPPPSEHLIAVMCRAAGISGRISLRPYVNLTQQERSAGRLKPRQIAIVSSGMSGRSPMNNKEWYPDRFQEVVSVYAGKYDFVQLGAKSDPPLKGALDLRGRTSIRESAAILSQSLLFVGLVGFLMHLARAVDCRSVILYGGREAPWQSGYCCNENLITALPCSPCWLWNTCPYDRQCMNLITADNVVRAVDRQVGKAGQQLEVEEAWI